MFKGVCDLFLCVLSKYTLSRNNRCGTFFYGLCNCAQTMHNLKPYRTIRGSGKGARTVAYTSARTLEPEYSIKITVKRKLFERYLTKNA